METKTIGVMQVDFKATRKDDGSYDFTLSVPTQDRDGEVVDKGCFDPLPEWIPIDVDHGMTVLSTVGSGVPVYDGDALKLRDFSFASTPMAQEVKTLVDEKHIRKLSVAFMDAQREVDEKDGLTHIRKAELLNAAIVAISSNREADIALRAFTAKVGARNSASDAQLLQAAHDAIVAAGAACEAKSHQLDAVRANASAIYREQLSGLGYDLGDTKSSTDTDPEGKAAAPAAALLPAEVIAELAYADLAFADPA